MSREIRRRLRNLELKKVEKLTPEERARRDAEALEELVGRVHDMFPDETELWDAYERSRILEPSDMWEDIENYRKTMMFVMKELRRLQADAAQPSK